MRSAIGIIRQEHAAYVKQLKTQLVEATEELDKARKAIQKLMESVLADFQEMHPIVFPKIDEHGKSKETDDGKD